MRLLLSSRHKGKVALEVARAFHAAVQARKMAIRLDLPQPEEVFIAALLTRIGNIAFWCFAGEVGDRLDSEVLNAEGEEQAEMKVLGFKLERLTLRLSQEWKLSDLLESALQDKNGTDPRVQSIKLGCAVAQASEKGWDCPQIKEIIKDAGDFLDLSEEETTETLHESARAAAEIAESYGAIRSSRLVPLPVEASPPPPVQAVDIQTADEITESARRKRAACRFLAPLDATPPLPEQFCSDQTRIPEARSQCPTVQPSRPLDPCDIGERRFQHGAFSCSGGHLSRDRHGQGRFCAAYAGPATSQGEVRTGVAG